MIVLNLLLIVVLIGFGLLDRKKIKSLEKMALNRDKYIALLEKRNREDRIYKNEQFNNKQK